MRKSETISYNFTDFWYIALISTLGECWVKHNYKTYNYILTNKLNELSRRTNQAN